jgi:hypothetical protein
MTVVIADYNELAHKGSSSLSTERRLVLAVTLSKW